MVVGHFKTKLLTLSYGAFGVQALHFYNMKNLTSNTHIQLALEEPDSQLSLCFLPGLIPGVSRAPGHQKMTGTHPEGPFGLFLVAVLDTSQCTWWIPVPFQPLVITAEVPGPPQAQFSPL